MHSSIVHNAYSQTKHLVAVYVVRHNHNVYLDRHSANKTSDQQMFAVKK